MEDELLVLAVGEEDLRTTAEHPFFVPGRGWVEAGTLVVGDRLLTLGGGELTVERVEKRAGTSALFNFSVEADHSYFVGQNALLVHNAALTGSCGGTTDYTSEIFEDPVRARAKLRSSLGTGAGQQGHHVIPLQVAKESEIVQRAAKGGFNVNSAENGINLLADRLAPSLQHRGSHSRYSDGVTRVLEKLYKDNPGLTDTQYAGVVRGYVAQVQGGMARTTRRGRLR